MFSSPMLRGFLLGAMLTAGLFASTYCGGKETAEQYTEAAEGVASILARKAMTE